MGSRGLSILEQLMGLAQRNPERPLLIEVFDPQTPGSGLHLPEQADYLMLNTMAGQISAFSAAFPATLPNEPAGLTFLQWCAAQDVRLDERGHLDAQGRPVEFGDFVPRRLLGRYLRDSYRYLLELCPAHVQLRHHPELIVGCCPRAGESGFLLTCSGGQQLVVDGVFLTTGHAPRRLDSVTGKRVAIEGLGLTAMDTLAELTQGRGGHYVRDNSLSGWRYLPSGREPQIYLFSRTGLPFHARPQWQPDQLAPQPPTFFSPAAIRSLRRESVDGRLDFVSQVLPLIEDEMRARCGSFDPQAYLRIGQWQGESGAYEQWFRQWIEADLLRSRLGRAASPLTQALEVWRDCRDVLRLAVDHNGLTNTSTQAFYRVWAALGNRLVGGPQQERYEDLLALMDAGIVRLLSPMQINGPDAQFDAVIKARTAHSGLSGSRSAVLADLLKQGLVRPAHPYPADGIEVDRQNRAVGSNGQVQPRLWVLGPAVEGSTFYNHYVPTPDPACRALLQARSAVESCLAALEVDVAFEQFTT
ncbi:FAD/NAD(P)-binding protein [Pseudomonas sp. DSP3-2-2]|uniref:FAD/NAD(P)-binding protein n=1 Tax=unclassified Pseudomonas TaxID=196821 RepID=UPI003CFB74AA